MRATDWRSTPVGPVESWPQSLRTSISTCLGSRFPILLWWGPELVMLYNDAYRPILGDKHPRSMGQRGRECWPEIWPIIGPMLAGVMESGEATWSENLMLPLERKGYAEECYFTFSYSPIRDESGGVGGVFTAVTETTEQVIGERRLRTLRDLAASAVDAREVRAACLEAARVLSGNPADVPFALLYLLSDDGSEATLAAPAGLPAGHPAAPARLTLSADDVWPLAEAARARAVIAVRDLAARFGPIQAGPYPEPVDTAVLVPLGWPHQEHPYAVLVAGVNPRRALDDSHQGFFELAGEHLRAALSNARAEEEEQRRLAALAELDRAKTTFFSNVSHEFRTPLTLMLGPLEDLLGSRGPELPPLARREVEVAHRNALRLLKLVNALLDFSRIEAGRMRASFEPVDLSQVTADLASVFRSAVESAGVRFRVDCPPLPELVYVDRQMWEKIVLNLLSNALKFTFEGEIAVSLRWTRSGPELTVADTGTGIADHELPQLFERFHRVQGARARSHEGSGIGLALVAELVGMHGGHVEVESELGRGSAFRVHLRPGRRHLPADQVEAAAAPRDTAARALPYVVEALQWTPGDASATAVDGPARILLADDNADMREYLRRLLSEQWTVSAVGDGGAALEAARRELPDLLIADVMMPGLDGFALLRALRADPRTRGITVVLLSARAGEEARIEGLAAGADDYLVKPFSARELVARVASHLALIRSRQAEAARRTELYELFMQAPAPICVLRGRDLVFEMANPLYEKVAGRQGIAGMRLDEALPTLVGQGFEDMLRRVLETGEARVGEEMLLRFDPRGDGVVEDSWWTFIYAPLRNHAGTVDRVVAFVNNVTDQVRARRQVEELNQRLRLAVDASELGTWSWDPERDVAEWSPRTYALLEVPPGTPATRELLLDRVHPDDRPRVDAAVQAAVRDGQELRVDFRLGSAVPGAERWVRSVGRMLGGRLTGTVADVTGFKRAEREAHLREIMARNTTQALFMLDARQRCTYMNPAAERLLGFAFHELNGRLLHDVVHHRRPDGRQYPVNECPIERALPSRSGVVGEDVFVHRDGHLVPVAFAASPIEEDGQPLGTVLELRDLTRENASERERRELLRREQEARREAEAASRSKDEFLALLGHELRNPLAPIVTALQLMKLKGTQGLEQEREVLERQVRHMTRLVDDLLDISRVTQGKIHLREEIVELAPVIARAVEMASPLFEERSHELAVAVPASGLRVKGDPFRLAQVFANLFTNAARYTPPGGHVEVRAWEAAGRVTVAVKDDGRGIAADMLDRIFEPFVQGERRHDAVSGGLGLGLPLVRSLVRLHQGNVTAASAGPGRGSEFVVDFPAAGLATDTAALDTQAAAFEAVHRGRRLLVVDDNEDAGLLVAEALRTIGYDCRVAHDGPTALDLAAEFKPSAAVVDIGLPVMDGYELARRLVDLLGPVGLVAVTGYGEVRDRDRSQMAGFAAHLVKPVDLRQLAETLAELTAQTAGEVPS